MAADVCKECSAIAGKHVFGCSHMHLLPRPAQAVVGKLGLPGACTECYSIGLHKLSCSRHLPRGGEPGINPKDLVGQLKVPMHLVPPQFIAQVAEAFRDGARKYGPYNWRKKKVVASIYIAACKRHLGDWWDGEEKAKDSGVHHLAHAAACLAILLDALPIDALDDDRPPPGAGCKIP